MLAFTVLTVLLHLSTAFQQLNWFSTHHVGSIKSPKLWGSSKRIPQSRISKNSLQHLSYNNKMNMGKEQIQTRSPTDLPWGSPPPESQGTLDFRYPDWVVEPRLECPTEGVFPHPRNCSWFYRCHDPFSIGYYRINYFECAPGTHFADDMDICVESAGADVCPGQLVPAGCYIDDYGACETRTTCPGLYSDFLWGSESTVCTGSTYTCSGITGQYQVCESGYHFDVTNWLCISDDSFCANRIKPTQLTEPQQSAIQCTDSFDNCFDYSQCDGYSNLHNQGYSTRLCSYNRVCKVNGDQYQFDICEGGYFDIYTQKCVESTISDICPYNRYLDLSCSVEGVSCYLTTSCDSANPVYRCSYYYLCSLSYMTRESGMDCNAVDTVYDQSSGICTRNVTAPVAARRETVPSCIYTTVTVEPDPTPIVPPLTATCEESQLGTVLDMSPEDENKYCEPKNKCASNGDYLFHEVYCSKFYECQRDPTTSLPTAVLTSCGDDQIQLFLQYKKCTPPPEQGICKPDVRNFSR